MRPPPYLEPLLRVLRRPANAAGLDDGEWDRLLRTARAARLHGVLAHRLQRAAIDSLPAAVTAQLAAARTEAAFARQMMLHEVAELRRALASLEIDMVWLKGAAYVLQDLECAAGRLPADVDIMVPKARLLDVERRLTEAGWEGVELGAYDARYYREWVHQLPPMRAPGHVLEVDLHHAILPPLGRMPIDTADLWRASCRRGPSGERVLAREDLVVHAVVHLFVDSDCTGRLRDLVDIGSLLEQFCAEDPCFAAALEERADALGAGVPLAQAATFVDEWLGVRVLRLRSHGARGRALCGLVARRLAPPAPDALPPCVDLPHMLLGARALWLRLPLHLAARHAAFKGWRRLRAGAAT